MDENQQDLIHRMAQTNNDLCFALRVAHDHLLMNNKTHTRTYQIVKETLDKHDPVFQCLSRVD